MFLTKSYVSFDDIAEMYTGAELEYFDCIFALVDRKLTQREFSTSIFKMELGDSAADVADSLIRNFPLYH